MANKENKLDVRVNVRDKRLHITLGAHLPILKAKCVTDGVTAQQVIRQLVADYLNAPKNKGKKITGIPFGSKVLRPKRIELKLTSSEMSALHTFALRENIAPSNWLIQRLQDAIAAKEGVSIGREELLQMKASLDAVQTTIVGISRNLNQITRAINKRGKSEEELSPERLLVLSEIRKKLLDFLKPAQEVLGRLDNPRQHPFKSDK